MIKLTYNLKHKNDYIAYGAFFKSMTTDLTLIKNMY